MRERENEKEKGRKLERDCLDCKVRQEMRGDMISMPSATEGEVRVCMYA